MGHQSDLSGLSGGSRSERLERALSNLLVQTPEIEAAAVVSFDGLPMASALPESMHEDRVAAMSAALLSLGEKAAMGLGRGELSQVYIEGETGTVFLVSADNEAVLVAVAAQGAKAGLMLYEVRRTAGAIADVLREDEPVVETQVPAQPEPSVAPEPAYSPEPTLAPEPLASVPAPSVPAEPEPVPSSYVSPLDAGWTPSYAPSTSVMPSNGQGTGSPAWS